MGISCIAMKVATHITTPLSLRNLLSHLKFIFAMALSYLGLKDLPQHQEDQNISEQLPPTSHFLLVNTLSPSLVPIPLEILTKSIKTRLPMIEYGEFLKRYEGDESLSTSSCAICLCSLEKRDEIRELCNCVHAFHRQCLDTWVDEDRVTCPLCRSLMFPALEDMKRCGEDPWRILSNRNFFGEEHFQVSSSSHLHIV